MPQYIIVFILSFFALVCPTSHCVKLRGTAQVSRRPYSINSDSTLDTETASQSGSAKDSEVKKALTTRTTFSGRRMPNYKNYFNRFAGSPKKGEKRKADTAFGVSEEDAARTPKLLRYSDSNDVQDAQRLKDIAEIETGTKEQAVAAVSLILPRVTYKEAESIVAQLEKDNSPDLKTLMEMKTKDALNTRTKIYRGDRQATDLGKHLELINKSLSKP